MCICSDHMQCGHPLSMSDPLLEETSLLLEDYLQHCLGGGCQPPPCLAARTLRRVAGEMLSLHRSFYDSCDQLSGDPRTILRAVSARIPDDGGLNWGRVVSLIAFAGVLAQNGGPKAGTPQELAEVLSAFLVGEHRVWLQNNGGWDGFHKYFNNNDRHRVQENSNVSGALMAAAGFGLAGLAFLLAVR
ncbi:hypothetical protein FKM82_004724 [Ascaphus truei]|uniref:bcl-2-like protein 10 n=1 Tax=Ascaphus truei TaxID=8439 RepID=UPI003F5ACFB1